MTYSIAALLLGLIFLAAMAPLGRLGFLVREFPDLRRRALGAFLLVAVLAFAVFYPAVSPATIDIEPERIWFPSIFAGHITLTVFLLVWWRLQQRRSLLRFLRLQRAGTTDLWLGLRAGLIGWLSTIAIMFLVGILTLPFSSGDDGTQIPPIMIWLARLSLGRKLLVILVAMTVEEAFFRAFLQSRLGWIPSSLLFALGHASYGMPAMLLGVFVISLIIGDLFRRTGRLGPCMIAHGVFDSIQLLVIIPIAVEFGLRGSLAMST